MARNLSMAERSMWVDIMAEFSLVPVAWDFFRW